MCRTTRFTSCSDESDKPIHVPPCLQIRFTVGPGARYLLIRVSEGTFSQASEEFVGHVRRTFASHQVLARKGCNGLAVWTCPARDDDVFLRGGTICGCTATIDTLTATGCGHRPAQETANSEKNVQDYRSWPPASPFAIPPSVKTPEEHHFCCCTHTLQLLQGLPLLPLLALAPWTYK